MKTLITLVTMLILFALPVFAQDQARFGAAGVGYFSLSRPNIQGFAAMGLPITSDNKAFSYTDFDVAVTKDNPQLKVGGLGITYTIRTGVAYKIKQLTNSWSLFGLAAPGFTANGASIFSNFEYGGFLHKSVGKGYGVLVALTAEKGSGPTNFAPRVGITKKF